MEYFGFGILRNGSLNQKLWPKCKKMVIFGNFDKKKSKTLTISEIAQNFKSTKLYAFSEYAIKTKVWLIKNAQKKMKLVILIKKFTYFKDFHLVPILGTYSKKVIGQFDSPYCTPQWRPEHLKPENFS